MDRAPAEVIARQGLTPTPQSASPVTAQSALSALVRKIPQVFRASHTRPDPAIAQLRALIEDALRAFGKHCRDLEDGSQGWVAASLWSGGEAPSSKWERRYLPKIYGGAPEAALPVWRPLRRSPVGFSREECIAIWAYYVANMKRSADDEFLFEIVPLADRLKQLRDELGISEAEFWAALGTARDKVGAELLRMRGAL